MKSQKFVVTGPIDSSVWGRGRKWIKVVFLGIGMLSLLAAQDARDAQRPISDFLENQGTFSPPFIEGWVDPVTGYLFLMDYAGTLNTFFNLDLPTTVSGSINERLLPNGAAEVSIILHTDNAWAWVVDSSGNFIFGSLDAPADIHSAVGDCTLQLRFINPAGPGAPLPDFLQLAFAPGPGQQKPTSFGHNS